MTSHNNEQDNQLVKQKRKSLFKKVGTAFGIVAGIAVISANSYLLFNEESTIEKSYVINDSKQVYADHHVSTIEKDAILAANEEIIMSTEANALSTIKVRVGQSISLNDELALFNSDETDNEQRKLEIERNAYEKELTSLESLLRTLEREKRLSSAPLTSIDSHRIDEELSITFQTEIAQSTPTEAITLIEQKIAEVERQLEIAENRLSELNTSLALTSPVNGIVADIKEENGTVTFILYSNEKNLITYITEDEWKKIDEGQRVEIDNIEEQFIDEEIIIEVDEDDVEPIEGSVIEKQKIPTTNSIWLDELEKINKLPDSKLFEVRMDSMYPFTETPFTMATKANIVIDESFDAYKAKEPWVMDVRKKIESEEDVENDELLTFRDEVRLAQLESSEDTEDEYITEQYVYVLGDDGTVRLAKVDVDFTVDGHAIITGEIEDGVVILNDKPKIELSRTFLPAPFELPTIDTLKTFTWKEYVKYLIY